MRKNPLPRRIALMCTVCMVAAGCMPAQTTPTGTPTYNPTYRSIAVMLTETEAAPTGTPTPYYTPTPTPTLTPTPPLPGSQALPGEIGQPVEANGLRLTVLGRNAPDKLGKLAPQPNSAFLDLEVILENTGQATLPYSRLSFSLAYASTRIEPFSTTVWPALLSGDLLPGEWVRGHVTFSIPLHGGELLLQYALQSAGDSLWVNLSQRASAEAPIPATSPNGADVLPGPGQSVTASGITVVVDSVSTSQLVGWAKPSPGNVFVDLGVTISSKLDTPIPYNAEYFSVKDEQGYEYPADLIPTGEMIHSGSLHKGQKVSGHMIFEVPLAITKLAVKYQPLVLTNEYKEIRIAVQPGNGR